MSVTKSATQPSREGKGRKKTGREARARANFLRSWKKSHAKYRLTDNDVEICDNFCKQFKAIPQAQRARLISKAVTEIIEKYRIQHELDQVDAFMQERINKAVRKWIRDRTRDAKEALGVQAKVTSEMYSDLPKEEQDKLQTIANEWNATGPSDEVQLDAAKKAIPKRSLAFFEDCRKQYGAVFFVLYAHKTQNGVHAGMMDYTNNMAGESRSFSSRMTTELVNANWGVMEAEQEARIRRVRKTKKTAHLATNKYGEPILPDVDLIAESGDVPTEFKGLRQYLQAVLRTFITMHWGLAGPVTSKEPTVPWSDIVKNPRDYISQKYLPSDLIDLLKDPSKVQIADCLILLTFWLKHQQTGKKKTFEFSLWRQSRFKDRVPREPQRQAPEVPEKPGHSVEPDAEESMAETPVRQTRSKKKAKGRQKKGKDLAALGESSEEESPVDSNESSADESPEEEEESEESEEESEESDGSELGKWADDDEWGGVDGTASDTRSMPGDTGNHGDENDQDDSEDDGLKPPRSSIPRSSPPDRDFPKEQTDPPGFGFPGSSPPPMDDTEKGQEDFPMDQTDPLSPPPMDDTEEGQPPNITPPAFGNNAGGSDSGDHSDNELDIEAVSQMVTPKKLAERDSRGSRSPGFLKTTPKRGREESHRTLDEDSDNPSDVDKAPVGRIKIGPPSKRKPSHPVFPKTPLPKRGRADDPELSDVDKTPRKFGPPPKKKKVSQPNPEARPAVPQDSPAKNTRGQTKPKPRPVRKAHVVGVAVDERFDLSRHATRSSDSPTKAPGHYARLNAGR